MAFEYQQSLEPGAHLYVNPDDGEELLLDDNQAAEMVSYGTARGMPGEQTSTPAPAPGGFEDPNAMMSSPDPMMSDPQMSIGIGEPQRGVGTPIDSGAPRQQPGGFEMPGIIAQYHAPTKSRWQPSSETLSGPDPLGVQAANQRREELANAQMLTAQKKAGLEASQYEREIKQNEAAGLRSAMEAAALQAPINHARDYIDTKRNELATRTQKFSTMQVDPEHAWNDRGGVAGKILGAIAVGLSQFGMGLAGQSGPNLALQMIDKMVDDDIALQQNQINKTGRDLERDQDRFDTAIEGSADQFLREQKILRYESAQAFLRSQQAEDKFKGVAPQFEEAINGIEEKKLVEQEKWLAKTEQTATNKFISGTPGGYTYRVDPRTEAIEKTAKAQKAVNEANDPQSGGVWVDGEQIGRVADPATARELKGKINAWRSTARIADQIEDIQTKGGVMDQSQFESLKEQMTNVVAKANEFKLGTQEDVSRTQTIFGKSRDTITSQDLNVLRNFMRNLTSEVRDEVADYGMPTDFIDKRPKSLRTPNGK